MGLFGGASKSGDFFRIGELNVVYSIRILARYGLSPSRFDVGGKLGRHLRLSVADGSVEVSTFALSASTF